MKLSADSPRRSGARRFGLELRRAIRARKTSARAIARDHSVGRTRLQNWLSGSSLPSVELAEWLADLLLWPELVDLARAARLRACDACGREFVVEHASPARYCSHACRSHQAKRVGARTCPTAWSSTLECEGCGAHLPTESALPDPERGHWLAVHERASERTAR